MTARLAQSDLVHALQVVAPVVGRGHLPAMSAVRLEARGDEIVVAASSADATIRHVVPLAAPGVGVAVVPLRALQRFAGSVTGTVDLDFRAATLTASAERLRVELHTIEADGWVELAEPVGQPFTLEADDVARMRRILHAAAPVASNPALASIRLEPGWAVALDGYRLAATKIGADASACVVPIDAAASALADADAEAGGLQVATDGQRIMMCTSATTCIAAAVASPIPDWRAALPSPPGSRRLTAKRADLLGAARRAESLGFNATGAAFTRIELTPASEHTIAVHTVDATLGTSDEEVDGVLTLPRVAFNARYLRQALEHARGDNVEFRLNEGVKAAVLDEGDHLQLVMPMRT